MKTEFFSVNFAKNQTGTRVWYRAPNASDVVYYGYRKGELVGQENCFNPPLIPEEDFPLIIDEPISAHRSLVVARPIERPEVFQYWVNDVLLRGNYSEPEHGYKDIRISTGEALIFIFANGTHYRISPRSFRWRNRLRSREDKDGKLVGNPYIKNQFYHVLRLPYTSEFFVALNPKSMENVRNQIQKGVDAYVYSTVYDSLEVVAKTNEDKEKVKYLNYLISLPPATQRYAVYLWDIYQHDMKNLITFLHRLRNHKLQFVDPSPKAEIVKSVGSMLSETLDDFDFPVQKDENNRIIDVSNIKVKRGMTLVLLKEPHPEAVKIVNSANSFAENVNRIRRQKAARAASSRGTRGRRASSSSRSSSSYASSSQVTELTAEERMNTATKTFHIELAKRSARHLHALLRQATAMAGYKYMLVEREFST